ncbi:hypothetical protein [Algibacter lectus]|uniref:hypothetical protein n=1 Tax=Algibacter lectus TaxID=221126 RepID=UPI002494B513|nr:hypothetical protein [Algibacter lectus]
MKKLKNLMLVALIGMSVLGTWSCNNEELYEEPLAVMEDESNEDVDDTVTDVNSLCDFTLENLEANSTVVVNCIIDLQGESLDLPENVTLLYEGGDIINGTLVFSEGSSIDGDLLGNTLEVGGTKPALRDTAFAFDPKRWGIIEGVVSDEVALSNRDILENTMLLAKAYGIDTFKIDELDAYFLVSRVTSSTSNRNFYPAQEAINIPADFNLIMTDNTHLRVFPNSSEKYSLLAVYNANNITVTGGNLYGDRDEHDYSNGNTHEWGHVLTLEATNNTIIDGVKILNGSGDGLKIHSLNFTFQDNYIPSHNIMIKNCVFDSNRRNNVSITDGYDIYIENNEVLNAGIDTKNSKGTNPKFGIDIEAVRTSDGNGGYIFYERSERIYIRNNTERGSAAGSITVHIGYDVTVEGNTVEKGLSYSYASGTKIINNIVTAGPSGGGTGIAAGKKLTGSSDSIFDNEISGNTVTGFNVGINVQNRSTVVTNNNVYDFSTGIFPTEFLKDSRISDNILVSERVNSTGIFINGSMLENVIIENNDVEVTRNALKITRGNSTDESAEYSFTLKNNIFKAPSYSQISYSKGVILEDNSFNHGIQVFGSSDIGFYNNTIVADGQDGIQLRLENTNIIMESNVISVGDKMTCIKVDSATSLSQIKNNENTCK